MNFPLIANIVVFVVLLFALAQTRHKQWSLAKKVLVGLVMGVVFGLALHTIYGSDSQVLKDSVQWFNIVGNGYVQLLQMIVMPLVFASILSAVARLHNASQLGKISFLTIGTLLFTTLIAALVGVLVTNLFGLTAEGLVQGGAETARLNAIESNYVGKVSDLSVPQLVLSFIPKNPFADLTGANPTSIISVVIFAAFLGVAALKLLKDDAPKGERVLTAIDTLQSWVMKLVRLVMQLTPYGVLALMTKVVAGSNLQDIIKLGSFVVASYLGLLIMFAVHGLLLGINGVSPLKYFRKVWPVLTFAFTSRSSAASIPLNVEAQTRRLGVPESEGYGSLSLDVAREGSQGEVAYHYIEEANGVPVMTSGLVESSQQEIDEVVRIITQRAASFTIVPASYTLTVVALTHTFRTRLGAELKAMATKNKAMGLFLRHVRIVDITDVAGAHTTDAIVAMCYAKTSHGRLLQQFGALEAEGGRGMLLDALAVADRHVDIVSAFSSTDMDDERLHQSGPKMLKTVLRWAEQLDDRPVRPSENESGTNILFNDLADRIRARGLKVAVDYGFDRGTRLPLVVGLPDKPFSLAVLTDDAQFMGLQSTRQRHRVLLQDIESLGWSVMTVWSVGAFVNPDKEVDRIVARLSDIYQEGK